MICLGFSFNILSVKCVECVRYWWFESLSYRVKHFVRNTNGYGEVVSLCPASITLWPSVPVQMVYLSECHHTDLMSRKWVMLQFYTHLILYVHLPGLSSWLPYSIGPRCWWRPRWLGFYELRKLVTNINKALKPLL